MAAKEEPVYQPTTQPKKPKRRNKSDLGKDFVAPDGGWGWVVCIAAGFSNVLLYYDFRKLLSLQQHFKLKSKLNTL